MNVSKKLVVLPILLLITLSMIGVVVAHWSEVIRINGKIEAGSLTVGFVEVECFDKEESLPDVPILTLNDTELADEFAWEWGPGSVDITDIAGPGVLFNFTDLDPSSGTGVGDNFPVSGMAGGAWMNYPDYGGWGCYGDFSDYIMYSLVFHNVGTNPVTVNVKMNTGFTDPPHTGAWDTFWQNDWTYLAVGQSKVVTLDFSCAEVWHAMDDPDPANHYPDGTKCVSMWRLTEVSQIGLQVLGDGDGSIVVSAVHVCPPKDIGDCECTLDQYVSDVHTGKTGYRKLWVRITEGYPSYWCHATFIVENLGTVPAVFKTITLIPDPPLIAELVGPNKWELKDTSQLGDPVVINVEIVNLVGVQLDYCQHTKAEMDIHIKQEALECHTYTFHVEIEAQNWDP